MDSKPPFPTTDQQEEEDRIPSYEESILTSPPPASSSSSKGTTSKAAAHFPSLTERLSQARTARIDALITEHIEPILADSVAEGLHRTTLVLIPSNVEALQSSSSSDPSLPSPLVESGDASTLTDFHVTSDAALRLVHLKGQQHSLDFWRQSAAVSELRRSLEARLARDGMSLHSDGLSPAARYSGAGVPLGVPSGGGEGGASSGGNAGTVQTGERKRAGFLRRKMNRTSDHNNEDETERERSKRDVVAERAGTVAPGSVKVKAAVQEVSMRAVTEMGLYDSKTGMAVVVEVDIG